MIAPAISAAGGPRSTVRGSSLGSGSSRVSNWLCNRLGGKKWPAREAKRPARPKNTKERTRRLNFARAFAEPSSPSRSRSGTRYFSLDPAYPPLLSATHQPQASPQLLPPSPPRSASGPSTCLRSAPSRSYSRAGGIGLAGVAQEVGLA